MKVFVISLKRSQDRRIRITEQLQSQNIIFEFFNAIDASEHNFLHSERAVPDLTYKEKGYYLLDSEVACFASHFEIWKKCIYLQEPILVLEDNIDINDDLLTMITHAELLIEKYQYIKLSSTYKSKFKVMEKLTILPTYKIIKYNKPTCGTTAYILSPIAAQKLLNNASEFKEPVDNYIDKQWNHGVKYVNIYPDICSRANIITTIAKKRKNKSNIKMKHKLTIELYRLKNQILNLIYNLKS